MNHTPDIQKQLQSDFALCYFSLGDMISAEIELMKYLEKDKSEKNRAVVAENLMNMRKFGTFPEEAKYLLKTYFGIEAIETKQ
jgi:hypothetical protein